MRDLGAADVAILKVQPLGGVRACLRVAEDIAMPVPARATIGDMEWLAGAWVGTRASGSAIEERWSPTAGGAMLGVSRTITTDANGEWTAPVPPGTTTIEVDESDPQFPAGATRTETLPTTVDAVAGASLAVGNEGYFVATSGTVSGT